MIYKSKYLGPNPPAQDRFTLVPLLRQVEWDVYAGSKDGRLATARPDAMADMHAFYRPMGYKTYEMKDWLGTPRLTYSDIKRPDDPTVDKFYYTYKLDYLSATTTYPFGAEIEELSFENSQYRFGFTGHLKDDIIRPEKGDGANYSTLFREYDPIIGRWWSIDPLRSKYAGMSPYNYAAGNPINAVDRDGDDVILLFWASDKGSFGHCAVAISNYKTIEKKVKENGKWITKSIQVADGTYSIRDLWPTQSIGKSNYWESVGANFSNNSGENFTYQELFTQDVTNLEGRPADGIVGFKTDAIKDNEVNNQLNSFEVSKKYYNAIFNNCSDYVKRALTTVAGKIKTPTYEKADNYNITTPNQLYKAALSVPGALKLKDAGEKVKEGSLKHATGDNVGKAVGKIPIKELFK